MTPTWTLALRPLRSVAVISLAAVAVGLLPAAAIASDPVASMAPAGPADLVLVADQGGPAEPVIITRTAAADAGVFSVMGGCGAAAFPVAGGVVPGGPVPDVIISGSLDAGGPQVVAGEGAVGCASGSFVVGAPGMAFEAGPIVMGTSVAGGRPAEGGIITVSAEPSRVVRVTGVNGTVVSLETDDGWTRDLETGSVAITLDRDTLTAADLQTGDEVAVVQVRNANDTYTVTGLQLVLPQVAGTVSGVTADGFTLTQPDGTVTPVVTTAETRWVPAGPGAATGPEALKDGDMAFVRGRTAEDGTVTAHDVTVAGQLTVEIGEAPGLPVPVDPAQPAPTPEASPAG